MRRWCYYVFLGSNRFSWNPKTQPIVSYLSAKIEYKSLTNATTQLLWLQSLLSEHSLFLPIAPILILQPSLSCLYKTHWDWYFFIRNKVAQKAIQVQSFPRKDQLADILTKPIVSSRFYYLMFKSQHVPLTIAIVIAEACWKITLKFKTN